MIKLKVQVGVKAALIYKSLVVELLLRKILLT